MQPRFTASMRRDWAGRKFEVVGPLYSLDAIERPIPPGTILTTTGEWGSRRAPKSLRPGMGKKVYARTVRLVKHRKGVLEIEEWVRVIDLLHFARPVRDDAAAKTVRTKENTRRALWAILNTRPSAAGKAKNPRSS